MKISLIFLTFAIMCFAAYANPVQPISEIDLNLGNPAPKLKRASSAKETNSIGSGSSLGLDGDAIESGLLPLHHIIKRGFWSSLGRNVGRGMKAVGSGLWSGAKAVGNAAFYNKFGYMPNQSPYQAPPAYGAPPMQPSYGAPAMQTPYGAPPQVQAPYQEPPPSSSQESDQYGGTSGQDVSSGGDYMYK